MTRTALSDPPTVAHAARPVAASPLLLSVMLAMASLLVASTLFAGAASLPRSGALLLVTAVPAFLAPLFSSADPDPRRRVLGGLLSWALAALLLMSLSWLVLGVELPLASLAGTSLVALGIVAVALLSTSAIEATLQGRGTQASTARDGAVWFVTAILWLAGSTPLWLGPVADLGARHVPLTPTVILACSPLAHLAAAAGHDVLRGEWFYGHSSLGSLQVDYPRVATLLVIYLVLAVALSLLLALLHRWSRRGTRRVSPESNAVPGS